MITSDTPLVCCWVWAAVWTYRGVLEDDTRAWVAAGLIGALGVLAKYSFLAFPASVLVFLLLSPQHRRQLVRARVLVDVAGLRGLGLAPILVWNAQHGWAGAGQLADRVGLSSRANWASIWPVLSFLGGEAAALGVIWWVAGLAAIGGTLARVARSAALRGMSRRCGSTRLPQEIARGSSIFSACGESSGPPAWPPACSAKPRRTGWCPGMSRSWS